VRADFGTSVAMTINVAISSNEIAIDRHAVEDSFRSWQAEQSQLDAELAESLAALEAYQSHLDAWQQDLARERQQLQEEREAFTRDKADIGSNTGEQNQEQLQVLSSQLEESRDKINSLTANLLERGEEVRALEQQRDATASELAATQVREHELAASLEQLREHAAKSGTEGIPSALPLPFRNGPAKSEPRSASPVLGSVMEQFGKLRQQRSLNRPNPKPR
jgi:septal ring factor EnvC (AmiA/AmiB activator)